MECQAAGGQRVLRPKRQQTLLNPNVAPLRKNRLSGSLGRVRASPALQGLLAWNAPRRQARPNGADVSEKPVLRSEDRAVHAGRPDRSGGRPEPLRLREWRPG